MSINKGGWDYAEVGRSSHGTMLCAVCGKKVESGRYRHRKKRKSGDWGYQVQHEACSLSDSGWAVIDAHRESTETDTLIARLRDWNIVPTEPTEEMLVAGQEAWSCIRRTRLAIEDCHEAGAVYAAMLMAAPEPPVACESRALQTAVSGALVRQADIIKERDAEIARLRADLGAERESCAHLAWDAGMRMYMRASDAHDSRAVGSHIAKLIRLRSDAAMSAQQGGEG